MSYHTIVFWSILLNSFVDSYKNPLLTVFFIFFFLPALELYFQ